jgi:hypothetical protein
MCWGWRAISGCIGPWGNRWPRHRAEHELTGKCRAALPRLPLSHAQKTWSCERRVVGKAEVLPGKANPRFVVTNLPASRADARCLYEDLYCVRGEMENRIKEQQLGLFADRTSTATMRANQLRLYFSSFAYVLMHGLRRLGLKGTQHARKSTVHDDPAEAAEDRCPDPRHGAQGLALVLRSVSLRQRLRADPGERSPLSGLGTATLTPAPPPSHDAALPGGVCRTWLTAEPPSEAPIGVLRTQNPP